MDLDTQAEVKRAVDQFGADDLLVVLGAPDAESAELFARTVTHGDPSYAGPLAAVPLGLPVYHILEDVVRAQVDAGVYQRAVGIMEISLDASEIVERVRAVRAESGAKG